MTLGHAESSPGSSHETPGPAYVEVAVPVPLRRTFAYRVPTQLAGAVTLGCRVAVPFGRRKLAAFVVGTRPSIPQATDLKEVAALLDSEPLFSDELLAFLREAADYYLHPIGEVLRAASPALPAESVRALRDKGFLGRGESMPGARVAARRVVVVRLASCAKQALRLGESQRRVLEVLRDRGEVRLDELRRYVKSPRSVLRSLEKKGLVVTVEQEAARNSFFAADVASEPPPELNTAQQRAVAAITTELQKSASAFLLHGVTGSGKTEVYLRVIAEVRARGLGAVMLVPEIALTPQLVSRFRARFGDAIAVLHSGLGSRQRHQAWQELRHGRLGLAIGARSALFAPVQRLGAVIVDEEHDGSFKQEEGFRYHARDMALLRAHRAGAVCVLGSATPSLESYYRAQQNKLQLLELPQRVTPRSLPAVEVVDLTRHRSGPTGHRFLTAPLHGALQQCLQARGQAILFLNRRGFAPSVCCISCGAVLECPGCSVALTEHKRTRSLRCHYCDFALHGSWTCPHCRGREFEQLGVGTERLEEAISQTFPQARVARLDRDTAAGEGLERILSALRERRVDILVGTQMVTKGHDIPGVTLVGVVLADQSLAFPDFRASERTFQLLEQVAGRAGRGDEPGRVVLQAYQSSHPAVRCARDHDYIGFCRQELRARRELQYSPFSRMVAVRIDAGGETQARRAAAALASAAKQHSAVRAGRVLLLGPAPAPIIRIRGRYRFRLMLRAADRKALRSVAAAICTRIDEGLGPARATVDVDPVSML